MIEWYKKEFLKIMQILVEEREEVNIGILYTCTDSNFFLYCSHSITDWNVFI